DAIQSVTESLCSSAMEYPRARSPPPIVVKCDPSILPDVAETSKRLRAVRGTGPHRVRSAGLEVRLSPGARHESERIIAPGWHPPAAVGDEEVVGPSCRTPEWGTGEGKAPRGGHSPRRPNHLDGIKP